MDRDVKTILRSMRHRHLNGVFVENSEVAKSKILDLIPTDAVVGIGDSATVRQVGVVEELKKRETKVLDGYDRKTVYASIKDWEELHNKLVEKSTMCDVFLTGTNAITARANRIAQHLKRAGYPRHGKRLSEPSVKNLLKSSSSFLVPRNLFIAGELFALESMMMRKKDLVNKILAIELSMFETVPSTSSESQKSPETFKTVRRSHFETWSQEALQSYLRDLNEALKKGRNLMTEKYAKIDRIAGFGRLNPIIDQIIEKEEIWRDEFNQKYPHILKDEERYMYGVPFWKVYLRAELETYSDETLEFRFQDILKSSSEGRNLLEESYTNMFKRIGYGSLEELELERRKEEKGN